jgi:gamma-glutamyltranspeptidase/glutathione hydrolase
VAVGAVSCATSSARNLITSLDTGEPNSPNGALATGYEEATRAGIRVLEEGGNAVDAAVTAAFAASSSAPGSSGLFGTTYILVRMADGRSIAIDGSGRVPLRVEREELIKLKEEDKLHGIKVAGVPGTLAALDYALKTFGTITLAEALAPAIELADQGFEVTASKRASIEKYFDQIRRTDYLRLKLLKDGEELPDVGTTILQRELAVTLRRIAEDGADIFYRGEIAEEIVADMRQRGGFVQAADLATYRVKLREPIHGSYRNTEVKSFPWPGGGGAVIEGLNILETFPSAFLCQPSADRVQALMDTFHMAYEDHYRFTGRCAPFDRAVDLEYTSKRFAVDRAALIQFERALSSEDFAPAERLYRPQGGTTQVSVVDRSGNVVALTQTVGRFYGGKGLHPTLGIIYNSFLEGYDLSDPNVMRPRSACPTDMAPTIVHANGNLVMALGSAASSRIPGIVAQVISNSIDCGLGPRAAVLAPRALWNPDPSGESGAMLEVFPPNTEEFVTTLEGRGYEFVRKVVFPATRRQFIRFGAVNAVGYDPVLLSYCAVADPRRQGFAMAASN